MEYPHSKPEDLSRTFAFKFGALNEFWGYLMTKKHFEFSILYEKRWKTFFILELRQTFTDNKHKQMFESYLLE